MKDQKSDNTQNANSVDQIRNILFGEQIAIIEKRFAQMETNLTESITELSNKLNSDIEKVDKKLIKTNSSLQSDNASMTEQHNRDIQSLEKSLSNKIIETESELINQIQSGLEKLDEKTSDNEVLAGLLKNMADKLLSK